MTNTLSSTQRRWLSSGGETPSSDEIKKAHRVLGTTYTMNFEEVRGKYRDLAKKHHPDVAGSSSSATSMGDINDAYNVLQRQEKHGGGLGRAPRDDGTSYSSGGYGTSKATQDRNPGSYAAGGSSNPFSSSSYYGGSGGFGGGFPGGMPFDDDGVAFDSAEFHEVMWEAMRMGRGAGGGGRGGRNRGGRGTASPYSYQNTEDYNFSDPPPWMSEFDQYLHYAHNQAQRGGGGGKRDRGPNHSRSGRRPDSDTSTNTNANKSSSSSSTSSKGTESSSSSSSTNANDSTKSNAKPNTSSKNAYQMLTDAERSALSNMYEEGKSFEFISNALGKPQDEVIKEYNLIRDEKTAGTKRQYQDRPNNHHNRRGGNNNPNNQNNSDRNRRKGNGSRQDRDVPFGHFVDFDEDGPFPGGRGGGGRGSRGGRGGRGVGTSNVFYDIDEEMMGRMMDEEVGGGPPPPGMSYFFDPVTGEVFVDADPEMMEEDGEYFVPGDEDFFEFEEGVGDGLFGHADRQPRRGGGRGGGGRGRDGGNGGNRKFNHYMHRGGGGGGGQQRRGGGGGGRGGGRGDYHGKS